MGEVNSKYGTFEPGDSQSFAIDFLVKHISESKIENSVDQSMISIDGSHYSKKINFQILLKNIIIKKIL